MYYMLAPTNSDLQHHGILGQKWGRKNGPPYPLDAGDHSAAERKAGYQKSIKKAAKAGLKSAVAGPYGDVAVKAQKKAQEKVRAKQEKQMNDRIDYINKHYADTPMTRDAMIKDVKKQFADSQNLSKNRPSKKEAGKHIVDLNEKRMHDNETLRYYTKDISDSDLLTKTNINELEFKNSAKQYLQDSGLLAMKVSDKTADKAINQYYKYGQKVLKNERKKLKKYFD